MSTKPYVYPGVAFELSQQSRLVVDGHSARWVESQHPDWIALMERRAALRNHEPSSSDAVVEIVKRQLNAKSRNRGITIAPASAPDGRK